MRDSIGWAGPRRRGTSSARRARAEARPAVERLEGRALLAAPLPPTGVAATGVSASAITISWNYPTDKTITGYDVYEKVWINGSHGGKGSGGGGHYVWNLIASNLRAISDTATGLATGTYHTYDVTAVNASGQSSYSADATAETWVAPSFPNGPNTYLLSVGALWSGPLNVTAGLTTQLSLLVSGNPLTFSVASGPSTVSIDPKSGVVTYTPAASEVGTVNVTFKASDPLGSVTQTIQFNVGALNPNLGTPKLSLSTTSLTYDGLYQQVSAYAVGKDGVTPVSGTIALAYNGGTGGLLNAGTYSVLATFTSSDPNYNNATLLTKITIAKASPTIGSLSNQVIAIGTSSTTFTGNVGVGTAVPAGDDVIVTLNGVAQAAPVDKNGNFTASFATSGLALGTYTLTYAFAADPNFLAAPNASSTLKVIPTAGPQVTQDPTDVTTSVGDGASFTAAATGSPTPTVQWQVSTDGGLTFTDVTSNASATTTTLILLTTDSSENGYLYRAVFTNSVGTAFTTAALLTVQTDGGGG